MGTIGAERLLSDYGGYDKVAEAWLEGRLNSYEQRYAPEIVNKTDLEAARMRIEMRREQQKLFSVHHEFQDLSERASSYTSTTMLFVTYARDDKEALALAKASQITEYRNKGIWTVEEAKDRVVRCHP
jgi:hypothetical protein